MKVFDNLRRINFIRNYDISRDQFYEKNDENNKSYLTKLRLFQILSMK